jgi:hypothetical protein
VLDGIECVVSEGGQPVFRGPRVIAIPLREKAKAALHLMEKSEFIEAYPPGPWGTPIVPVLKSNGQVRICGDYSVTLNPFGGRWASLTID